MKSRTLFTFVAAVVTAHGCGESSTIVTKTCTPGQSMACAGPNACAGFQVCVSDGSSFGACQCGSGGGSSSSTIASSGVGGAAESSASSASAGGAASSSSAGGAAGWTPMMLPGLVLWLDDDIGLVNQNGHVTGWLDQSGQKNDAAASGTPYPTLEAASLNGHDVVMTSETSSWLELQDSPTLHWGKGDFGMAFVTKDTGDKAYVWSEASPPVGEPNYQLVLDTQFYRLYAGMQADGAAQPMPIGFDAVIARGQALRVDVGNDHEVGPTNPLELDPSQHPIALGQCGVGSTVRLAEVVAVNGPLSDAEVVSLQTYFKSKFKL